MRYYFYYVNALLTTSRFYSRFKKRTRCQSFRALTKASVLTAADWLSQAHQKLSEFFTCGETVFPIGGNHHKALLFM